MALDLLKIEPHKVKAGVQGKMFLLYGGAKVGKTTVACQFDKPLLLAFESGYNLIDGINAVPVSSWLDLKSYVKQLKKDDVRATYDTIIIDTVDIMWGLAEKFVKLQADVEDLTDMAFGKGYRKVRDEFQDVINSLGQMGYTLIFISHAEKKDYTDVLGVTHSGITPTLDKRPKEIITGLVDVMMFINEESDGNGGNKSVAYFRGGIYGENSKIEIEAGSRYGEGLPVKIVFSYDNLIKAVQSADEAMVASGAEISTKNKTILEETKAEEEKNKDKTKRTFQEVYADLTATLEIIKTKIKAGDNELQLKVTEIVEAYLGPGKKITEASPAQIDLVEAALKDLKELA